MGSSPSFKINVARSRYALPQICKIGWSHRGTFGGERRLRAAACRLSCVACTQSAGSRAREMIWCMISARVNCVAPRWKCGHRNRKEDRPLHTTTARDHRDHRTRTTEPRLSPRPSPDHPPQPTEPHPTTSCTRSGSEGRRAHPGSLLGRCRHRADTCAQRVEPLSVSRDTHSGNPQWQPQQPGRAAVPPACASPGSRLRTGHHPPSTSPRPQSSTH